MGGTTRGTTRGVSRSPGIWRDYADIVITGVRLTAVLGGFRVSMGSDGSGEYCRDFLYSGYFNFCSDLGPCSRRCVVGSLLLHGGAKERRGHPDPCTLVILTDTCECGHSRTHVVCVTAEHLRRLIRGLRL